MKKSKKYIKIEFEDTPNGQMITYSSNGIGPVETCGVLTVYAERAKIQALEVEK